MIYSRNPGVDHWDGYTGQYAVVYDDFAATRNANSKPGEYAEMLSIVSNEQYRLPMASLDEKGDVFRSKVVICTSNDAHPRPNTLNNHEALWRRRHAMYHVSASNEPGDNRQYRYLREDGRTVDPAALPEDNSHLRFRRYMVPINPQGPLGPVMTYDEFVDEIVALHARHQENQQLAISNFQKMVAKSLAVRENREVTLVRQAGTQFEDAVSETSSDDDEVVFDDSLSNYARTLTTEIMEIEKPSKSFLRRLAEIFMDYVPKWEESNWFAKFVLSPFCPLLVGTVVGIYFLLKKKKTPVELFNEKFSINRAQWEDWQKLSLDEQGQNVS